MKQILDTTFKVNAARGAEVTASSTRSDCQPAAAVDDDYESFWAASPGNNSATLEFKLKGAKTVNVVMLQENIREGQRIEAFTVEAMVNGAWKQIAEGTTVGYKRLLRIPETTSDRFRLTILQSRTNPTLSSFGLYTMP